MLYCKLILFILLVGCGFKPLYGKNSHFRDLKICINDSSIHSENEILRTQLFGALDKLFILNSSNCKYHISGNLKEDFDPSTVQKDATIARYNLTLYLNFNIETDTWQKSDNLEISGSYLASESEYANFYAIKDTKRKLVENLAEELRYKILLIISKYETSS